MQFWSCYCRRKASYGRNHDLLASGTVWNDLNFDETPEICTDFFLLWMDLTSVQVSESLVVNEGEFLLRDSQSSQGGFVLTCRWEQETLHFPIRKIVVQSGKKRSQAQYSLEGEAFDSIPDLVRHYMGSRAAVSLWSKAQIYRPVNRTLPLGFLEKAFSASSNRRDLKEDGTREERLCPSRWRFTLNSWRNSLHCINLLDVFQVLFIKVRNYQTRSVREK